MFSLSQEKKAKITTDKERMKKKISKTKTIKMKQKVHKTNEQTWSLCVLASPGAWLIHPMTPLKKIDFPFSSMFQMQMVSGLGVALCVHSLSQCWELCGPNLCRSCDYGHSLCGFTHISSIGSGNAVSLKPSITSGS